MEVEMNIPTLIIGLGGVGSEIAALVERYTRGVQNDEVSFVIMDTDINTLEEIRQRGYQGYEIQTSEDMTVKEYLDWNPKALENWFLSNELIKNKTVTEGAGQIRMISRLALEMTINNGGVGALHEAIDRLYMLNGITDKHPIKIIVVSSLAGGTGSGMLLEVSLYIQQYLKHKYKVNGGTVAGFFILPNVFSLVTNSKAEQYSLGANAYATMKELLAFTKKSDGTLDTQYKGIEIRIPDSETYSYQSAETILPYRYCFLFDKVNAGSRCLKEFDDYKKLIAQCIYIQAISPIKKDYNSRLINIDSQIMESHNAERTRVAIRNIGGQGVAILKYPYDKVKRILGFQWAQEVFAEQWMTIDCEYQQMEAERQKKMHRGIYQEPMALRDFYVIKMEQSEEDLFKKKMIELCLDQDQSGKWELYLEKLEKYIERKIEQHCINSKNHFQIVMDSIELLEDKKQNGSDNARNLVDNYKKYLESQEKDLAEFEKIVSSTIFPTVFHCGVQPAEHHLTYWLYHNQEMIHPNAVRYFLIKLEKSMEDRYKSTKEEAEKFKKEQLECCYIAFKVRPGSEDREVLVDKKIETLSGMFKMGERKKIAEKFKEVMNEREKYLSCIGLNLILEEGKAYVSHLLDGYEAFYGQFAENIYRYREQKEELVRSIQNHSGKNLYYVAASGEFLEEISGNIFNLQDPVHIKGEVSELIFSKALGYQKAKRLSADQYYRKVYQGDIVDYWQNEVEKRYGKLLNTDVLGALNLELKYGKEKGDKQKKRLYYRKIINKMNILSQPFVERTKPSVPEHATWVMYAPEINDYLGDDGEFVNYLNEKRFHRVYDGWNDKYTIVFFQAYFGIRAEEMRAFKEESSSYFRSYDELLEGIPVNEEGEPSLVPHIDKYWHLPSRMPDINKKHYMNRKVEIAKAFVCAIIMKKFILFDNGNNLPTKVYKYEDVEVERFDEILYEMERRPAIRKEILKDYYEEIAKNQQEGKLYEETSFYYQIEEFTLEELKTETDLKIGVFAILLLYKKAIPKANYKEKDVRFLADIILDILYEFICSFLLEEREYQYKILIRGEYLKWEEFVEWYCNMGKTQEEKDSLKTECGALDLFIRNSAEKRMKSIGFDEKDCTLK